MNLAAFFLGYVPVQATSVKPFFVHFFRGLAQPMRAMPVFSVVQTAFLRVVKTKLPKQGETKTTLQIKVHVFIGVGGGLRSVYHCTKG